jgi:serine/threonine-protein kinase
VTLASGVRLGPYEILAPLGAGGMGEVYRARDPRLDREVAVKVLPPELAADPDRLRRFQTEAKATGALNHPNVLVIYDIGGHEGSPYVVSELLEGETLRGRMGGAALPFREVVELGGQVAQGLAAAHEKGIVHRDLKPENLFVTTAGLAKILDFGLATVARVEPLASDIAETASLAPGTESGTVLGSLGYMSPEQVRGQPVDHRSDIFSFGIVLYEMLSGRRPFLGDTPADTLSAILTQDPVEPPSSGVEVPIELSRIVMRCLGKRPEERFQSARDLAFALKELSVGSATQVTRAIAPADDRPSIAVLPFANLSADAEQEFFCDGMAEEILNTLAHVEGLRVIARTSSFAFKGRHEDIREIGAKLDVTSLLEGSVRRAGNRLRITAQLIDVSDGSHLWSERYDRQLEDVFAIQDEIALAIVQRLKVTLLRHEREAIVRRPTESLEAYDAYLKARYHWSSFTPEGFARSRECVIEAIQRDPGFAEAYGFFAGWHFSQALWADRPPGESMEVVLSLAAKTLALDAGNAWVSGILGTYHFLSEVDRAKGEVHLRQAIDRLPSEPTVHVNLALFLLNAGRAREAIAEARLALRLDPLSPNVVAWHAGVLADAGHYDEGVAGLEKQVALQPGFWLAHYELSRVLQSGSRLREARVAAEKAVELSGGLSAPVGRLACICYALGDTGRGDELLQQLLERSGQGYVPPSFLAWVYLARGNLEECLRWLEKAQQNKDLWRCFTRLYTRPFLPAGSSVDAFVERVGW